MSYTVYKHTSPSGKVYIGITNRNPEKRWGTDGMYYKGCKKFYQAIQKYGWDNIEHEVLYKNLSEEDAKQKEIDLISHYKAFGISYNLTDGGDGSLGLYPNEETRKKIGEKSKGRTLSQESRKKLSESLKGKKKPDGFGEHLSNILKGRKHSPEHIEKNRLAHLGQKNSRESIEKQRQKMLGRKQPKEAIEISKQKKSIPIIQYDKEGNFITFWGSAKDVYFEYGYLNTLIIRCCRKKLQSAYGYVWRYLSDEAKDVSIT